MSQDKLTEDNEVQTKGEVPCNQMGTKSDQAVVTEEMEILGTQPSEKEKEKAKQAEQQGKSKKKVAKV